MSELNITNFVPLGDRILVTMAKQDETTNEGIILQGSQQKTPTRAIVRFMPVTEDNKWPFKVGDIVQFGEQSYKAAMSSPTVVNGETLHIINATTLHGYYPQ